MTTLVAPCPASIFDRTLCYCCEPSGVMHTFQCDLAEGHSGNHIAHEGFCDCEWSDDVNPENHT